jgi:tRNA(Ser,Leu) C12 N-acetylase TAN1
VRPWNVLATALEGRRDALLMALRRLGRFGGGGYRNILTGLVSDPPTFLAEVREALASDRLLATALARLVPIELRVRFDPDDPATDLAAAAEPFLDRIGSGTFYVRVERRGLKGRLHSGAVEREVGTRVWTALAARGHVPHVAFQDPDHVLAVETLGEEAGLGLLPRTLRHDYPFVRVA